MPASFDFEEISDEFFSVFRCVLALISIFSGTWFADGLVGCRASRIEFEYDYGMIVFMAMIMLII